MKRKDPFQAPDGYFDSLADRIEKRIDSGNISVEKKGRQVSMPVRWGYAAAAVITLLAVFFLLNPKESAPTADELIAQLSDDEIIDYLASTDISLEEIMEYTSFENWEADSLQDEVMPDLDLSPGEMDELMELYDLEELENS